MVTSTRRPTEPRTNTPWKLITAVLAVVAFGALVWAFSLQSRMNDMHSNMGAMTMEHSGGMSSQMPTDLGPAGREYDKRFIDAMIPHHESAVEMARDAQSKTQRPEIMQLAKAIIDAQTGEIAQLKQWRSQWY
jgi:uncharacterized protein (DUF305 family)